MEFLITVILENRRDNPELYQLFFTMLADENLPSDLREIVRKNGQELQERIRQLVVEGQATGEVADDDPDQLVTVIVACLQGIWMRMASLKPQEVQTASRTLR